MRMLSCFRGLPLLFLAACASLTHESRHQYVLVQSEPAGADVLVGGKKVAETPAFVELRRQARPDFEISLGQRREKISVPTRYDWGESFWPNFVLLHAAPVGWGIDALTGAAWRLSDPPLHKFIDAPLSRLSPPSRDRVAIAPPRSSDYLRSDEAGLLWEAKLKQLYPSKIILPFREKRDEFIRHEYDFDAQPTRMDEYALWAHLGANEIFESQVEEIEGALVLTGYLRNVFDQTRSEPVSFRVEVLDESGRGRRLPWFARQRGVFQFIPNTIGLELSSDATQLSSNAELFKAQAAPSLNAFEKTLGYLSAISINRLQSPRRESVFQWRFQFVPNIRVANKAIYFPDFAALGGAEFYYLQIAGGYGPEVGLQKGPHYLYLNYIPMLGYHRLAWKRPGQRGHLSLGAFTHKVELGYLYFWNPRFSSRLFSKLTSSPRKLWARAAQDLNSGVPVTSSEDLSVGFSFSYTFNEGLRLKERRH